MSDVSGVWSMVAGMANGSNDMLSAVKKRLSSKLGSRASVLKLESLSDDVNVGEEKPEVGVGPPAPLLRRLRWSSALLSRKPFGSPEAGKPMVSEAESSGCGSDGFGLTHANAPFSYLYIREESEYKFKARHLSPGLTLPPCLMNIG